MIYFPPGIVSLGCRSEDPECDQDEYPRYRLFLDEFWIDQTEVTVEAYHTCVAEGSCSSAGLGEGCMGQEVTHSSFPINCVSWYQAKIYCESLGKQLPTEAQWERAARHQEEDIYPWGNKLPTPMRAVFGREQSQGIEPICSRSAGRNGLCDMAGNVREWVENCYLSSRITEPASSVRARNACISGIRVTRGGSAFTDAKWMRVSDRSWYPSNAGYQDFGFRCVVSPHTSRTAGMFSEAY
ncbi:MAG: formylglycine-generating enzyme family protein [Myxococcales bacterium]|nr:formylglycine-generating enzyme family protein [Myxococcales bacterium]